VVRHRTPGTGGVPREDRRRDLPVPSDRPLDLVARNRLAELAEEDLGVELVEDRGQPRVLGYLDDVPVEVQVGPVAD